MAETPANPFCKDLWQTLQTLDPRAAEIHGNLLFEPGQASRGIYLVEQGEVTLRLHSGKALDVAGPGTVLGLSEVMSGAAYRLSAEPSSGARISYIGRDELLDLLHRDHHCCMEIVRLLSENLHGLYHRCRRLIGPAAHPAARIH